MKRIALLPLILILGIFLNGCAQKESDKNEVVIYTSLDQVFSDPVLQAFEKQTGIKVKIVYDVEAAKTTGLVNRLIAEKDNPQADVFWNSEVGRTLFLKSKGVLTPYISPSAKNIPETFKDQEGYWTGFAARARVLIYNTKLVKEVDAPKSIFALTQAKWKGSASIANPLFGTTSTHSAALFSNWGDAKTIQLFKDMKKNDIAIVDGNSVVRDQVAEGKMKIGLTDTDDATVGMLEGMPIKIVYPDQDTFGTLVIPNTVALIKNAPHLDNAKKLIDYLLSEEVESKLSFSGSMQMPVRGGVKTPDYVPSLGTIKAMKVNFEDIADNMEKSAKVLQEVFLR